MNKKKCIYSVLLGDYEKFTDPNYKVNDETDLKLFTDNPSLKSEHWDIILIEPRFPCDIIRSSRYLKILGPKLLQNYESSLYLDNTVKLKIEPDEFIDSVLKNHDFALPVHSFRDSVISEFDTVQKLGYDDFTRVYEQLFHYQNCASRVLKERPYWCAILARKHTVQVIQTMELWWDQVLRYSRRDQLSINYALSKTQLAVNAIQIDNYLSRYHQWPVNVDRKTHKTSQNSILESIQNVPISELAKLKTENYELRSKFDASATTKKQYNIFKQPRKALLQYIIKLLIKN